MPSSAADRSDFGNPLAAAAPSREAYPWRPWLCLGLLLACCLPRAALSWRLDVICEDGPFYIAAAQHLEAGRLSEAFAEGRLRLNTYPIVLAWLHALGCDWVAAGQWWGVLASTLAVLPMFGWARRQFNDTVATVTCLLYAGHPALIERSPEVLRCPTYWLLMMLTLYLLWRAVLEVRLVLFVLAGVALALAIHTRVESWFLTIPWTLWSAGRFAALTSGRRRLAAGALLGVAMIPLAIVAVNLTWLRHHPQWEFCFSHRVAVLRQWLNPVASPAVGDLSPAMPPRANHVPPTKLAWQYVRKQVDAFGALGGSLALVGLWLHRRTLARRDQLAVCVMSALHFVAIGVHQWQSHDVIGRYFFPIVLVTMPYVALGLMELAAFIAQRAARFASLAERHWATPQVALVSLVVTLMTIGAIDGTTNNFDNRRQRRDLGQWILANLGPNQLIVGSEDRELMLTYYSQGRYCGLLPSDLDSPWFQHIMQADPVGLVVIWKDRPATTGSVLSTRFRSDPQLQPPYQAVAAETLPSSCRRLTVLIRPAAASHLARKPG